MLVGHPVRCNCKATMLQMFDFIFSDLLAVYWLWPICANFPFPPSTLTGMAPKADPLAASQDPSVEEPPPPPPKAKAAVSVTSGGALTTAKAPQMQDQPQSKAAGGTSPVGSPAPKADGKAPSKAPPKANGGPPQSKAAASELPAGHLPPNQLPDGSGLGPPPKAHTIKRRRFTTLADWFNRPSKKETMLKKLYVCQVHTWPFVDPDCAACQLYAQAVLSMEASAPKAQGVEGASSDMAPGVASLAGTGATNDQRSWTNRRRSSQPRGRRS